MDRKKLKELEPWIVKTLEDAGIKDKFNVEARFVGGTFTHSNAKLKLEVADVGEDGSVKTAEAEAWKIAVLDGLPEDGLGNVFQFRNRKYKVTGYKPGCKYNIVAARQPDSKVFCFEARTAFRDNKAATNGSRP